MSRLGLGGLVSGVTTDNIIEKIMEMERIQVTRKEMKKLVLQEEQSAWNEVKTSLQALRTKLDTLRFVSTYRSREATLTDEAVASVTASAGATLTTHTLKVNLLAQSHVVASHSDQADKNAVLGLAPGSFTLNGKSISVDANDTLNSIRDKINTTTDVGVTAEVVKVQVSGADRYRLVLTAKDQGLAGAITMSNDATTQALGFIDAGTGALVNELSTAQDADFELDGVGYTTSSNTVSDLIPNLSITLKKGGGAETNITVEQDTSAAVKAAQGWVDQFNATMDLLKSKTAYDAETKKAGILNGDGLARRIQTNLRGMLSNVVSGLPADLNQMSHIGITSGKYGTDDYGKVRLDSAKLEEKLKADADGVAKVFGALRTNVGLATGGATATASSSASADSVYDPANVINGDTDSQRFGSAGGGWESAGAPDPATSAVETLTISLNGTKTIDQMRLWLPDTDTYVASASGLKDYRLLYQATDGSWQEIESVTNHSGPFKTFDFDAVQATAVKLEVTATYGTGNPARVTELEVNEVNNGTAVSMYQYVRGTLEYQTGPVDTRDATFSSQIEDLSGRIERMNDYLTRREENLRRQFARMEEALSRLQSQGGFLSMQMMGMMNTQK